MNESRVLRLDPRGDRVVAVANRVLERLDPVVERMGHAYRAEVPEYAALPEDELRGQVLPVSRRIVEQFFRPLVDGRQPDARQVVELTTMGRKRLEMGIPLEPMLHVYRIAGRVVWEEVCAVCSPEEATVLAELGALWMDYMDRAASIAAGSYLDASTERIRRDDARRQALLDALLAAADAAELAAVSIRFSTVLAPGYVPVFVEGYATATSIDRLLDVLPDGALGGLRGGRVLLLVPAPFADAAALSRRAGQALVAMGEPVAAGPNLVAAISDAEALLTAAEAAGRRQGVVGPDDLLLERALVGNPRVAAALRRRVESLHDRDRDGLLVSTLRSYLRTGSVPATARAEVVHTNTVLYRLQRVRELTGLDPRVPVDAAVLCLAVHASGGDG